MLQTNPSTTKESRSKSKTSTFKQRLKRDDVKGSQRELLVRTEKRQAEIDELRSLFWAVCRGEVMHSSELADLSTSPSIAGLTMVPKRNNKDDAKRDTTDKDEHTLQPSNSTTLAGLSVPNPNSRPLSSDRPPTKEKFEKEKGQGASSIFQFSKSKRNSTGPKNFGEARSAAERLNSNNREADKDKDKDASKDASNTANNPGSNYASGATSEAVPTTPLSQTPPRREPKTSIMGSNRKRNTSLTDLPKVTVHVHIEDPASTTSLDNATPSGSPAPVGLHTANLSSSSRQKKDSISTSKDHDSNSRHLSTDEKRHSVSGDQSSPQANVATLNLATSGGLELPVTEPSNPSPRIPDRNYLALEGMLLKQREKIMQDRSERMDQDLSSSAGPGRPAKAPSWMVKPSTGGPDDAAEPTTKTSSPVGSYGGEPSPLETPSVTGSAGASLGTSKRGPSRPVGHRPSSPAPTSNPHYATIGGGMFGTKHHHKHSTSERSEGRRASMHASSDDEYAHHGALSGSSTIPQGSDGSSASNGTKNTPTLGSLQLAGSPTMPITLASLSAAKDARATDGKHKPAISMSPDKPITLASLSSSHHSSSHGSQLSPTRKTDSRRHDKREERKTSESSKLGSSRRASDHRRKKHTVAKALAPAPKKTMDGYLVQDFDDEEDAVIEKAKEKTKEKEKEDKDFLCVQSNDREKHLRSSDSHAMRLDGDRKALSSSHSQPAPDNCTVPNLASVTSQKSLNSLAKTVPKEGMEILETIGRLESVAVPKNFLVLMYPDEKTTIPVKPDQYKIDITDFVITVAKQKFISLKFDSFYICDAFAREIRSATLEECLGNTLFIKLRDQEPPRATLTPQNTTNTSTSNERATTSSPRPRERNGSVSSNGATNTANGSPVTLSPNGNGNGSSATANGERKATPPPMTLAALGSLATSLPKDEARNKTPMKKKPTEPKAAATGYAVAEEESNEDDEHEPSDMTEEQKKAYDAKLMAELMAGQQSEEASDSSDSDSSSSDESLPKSKKKKKSKNQEDQKDDILMMRLNSRFQEVAIELFSLGIYNKQSSLHKLNMEFLDISRDFLSAASSVGKIIISEVYISEKKKTIKPISVGGTIGGEKYIVHSILFKHAIGSGELDDDMAAKIAGHELKGLVATWECHLPGLHFPLQCLIDYLGFRLVAMLLLPLRGDTLKVGTNDGGKTMNYHDEELMKKMQEIGQGLNLAPHSFHNKKIYCAADLEGHVGTDGRRYLIDLSRTFPPCPPQGKKVAHLYRLFRPEFVKLYKEPLCSDGFSHFCDNQSELRHHNRTLKQAYSYLLKETIPEFAIVFDRLVENVIKLKFVAFRQLKFNLARVCHQNGMNLRLLGHLQRSCKNKNAKNIILVEMVARTIIRMIRLEWRNKMKEEKFPLETPYIDVFVTFMNKFIRGDDTTQVDLVQKAALDYYEMMEGSAADIQKIAFVNTVAPTEEKGKTGKDKTEKKEEAPLTAIEIAEKAGTAWGLLILLDRVITTLGIRVREEYLEKWTRNPESLIKKYVYQSQNIAISKSSIQGLDHKVKHMNVISHAEGYIIKGEKISTGNSEISLAFTNSAIECFETALNSSTLNKVSLRNLASEYSKYWFGEDAKVETDPSVKEAQIEYTKYLFIQALKVDPDDTHTLYQYANFFYHAGQYDLAEEWVLKSLIADRSHYFAFQLYMDVLNFVATANERGHIIKQYNDMKILVT